MAIRNALLGGTDFTSASDDGLTSTDLNDTFDALYQTTTTLSTFWENDLLSEPYYDFDLYTVDDDLSMEHEALTGTTIDSNITNPENAFDENDTTYAYVSAYPFYVGKTFSSKYIYAVYIKMLGDVTHESLSYLETYDGSTWTAVETIAYTKMNYKGYILIDDTVQGIRIRSTQYTTSIYTLDMIESKPTTPFIVTGYMNEYTSTTDWDVAIKNNDDFPDSTSRKVVQMFTECDGYSNSYMKLMWNTDLGDSNFYFLFNTYINDSAGGAGVAQNKINFSNTDTITFDNENSIKQYSGIIYGIFRNDETVDIYYNGFKMFNIAKDDLNISFESITTTATSDENIVYFRFTEILKSKYPMNY